MSSYTTAHYRPPPPQIETRVEGSSVTSASTIFGERGCLELREVLDDLASSRSRILADLTEGWPADEAKRVRAEFAWKKGPRPDTYLSRLEGVALPPEARLRGIDAVDVQFRVGHGVLETSFDYTHVATKELTAKEKAQLEGALLRAAGRRANQSIALTVQQQTVQKIQASIKQTAKSEMKVYAAQQQTLRVQMLARARATA